jgi:cytochrome oxidase Cu insertion factor (SCO1/SenC/PrrC family)
MKNKSPIFVTGNVLVGAALAFTVLSAAAWAQDRGARGRHEDRAPKVGDVAPTFTLKSLDGTQTWSLETLRDTRPVVLLFGSYT